MLYWNGARLNRFKELSALSVPLCATPFIFQNNNDRMMPILHQHQQGELLASRSPLEEKQLTKIVVKPTLLMPKATRKPSPQLRQKLLKPSESSRKPAAVPSKLPSNSRTNEAERTRSSSSQHTTGTIDGRHLGEAKFTQKNRPDLLKTKPAALPAPRLKIPPNSETLRKVPTVPPLLLSRKQPSTPLLLRTIPVHGTSIPSASESRPTAAAKASGLEQRRTGQKPICETGRNSTVPRNTQSRSRKGVKSETYPARHRQRSAPRSSAGPRADRGAAKETIEKGMPKTLAAYDTETEKSVLQRKSISTQLKSSLEQDVGANTSTQQEAVGGKASKTDNVPSKTRPPTYQWKSVEKWWLKGVMQTLGSTSKPE